jgi:hypothetical protein
MSSKRPRSPAWLIKRVVDIASRIAHEAIDPTEKDPAAVALGRKGGQKGGRARAKSLSAKKRTAIARKAARSRWKHRT